MPTIYGNSSQIVQGPGYVAITYEMIHDTRVIPLDAAPHLGDGIRSDFGDSRGHWEGETLVVETTNFLERSVYRNANAGSAHGHRALHAASAPDRSAVDGDDRRSDDVDDAVDVLAAADA